MWLETLLNAELRGTGVPGGSVAIIDRRGRMETGAAGLADVRAERAATPDTAYRLFSGTKLFTATAIMQLVEAGKVRLDETASTYLPDVLGACGASVQHLLSHTSGLADTLRAFLAVHAEGEPQLSTAVALSRFKIRVRRPPGQAVEYRNVNYALLGEIIARVSGCSYQAYVAEHILKPLAMPVAFTTTEAMRPDIAIGYVGAFEPMRFLAPLLVSGMRGRLWNKRIGSLVEVRRFELDTAAVGGLIGSAVGFLPFLFAQLNNGGAVLGAHSIRQMQSLVFSGAAGVTSRVGIGLGWKHGAVDGVPFLNHEGGGPGFTSEMRLYPTADLGIVVCLNRWIAPTGSHLAAHRLCEAIRHTHAGGKA